MEKLASHAFARFNALVNENLCKASKVWVLSVGATPQALVAVRVSTPRSCESSKGFLENGGENKSVLIAHTDFLPFADPSNASLPGTGFSLLVRAIAAGPRALGASA